MTSYTGVKQMKFVAQWYEDENKGGLFRKSDSSKFVTVGPPLGKRLSRAMLSEALQELGFKLGRWRRTQWGFEATAQNPNLSDSV